MGEQFYRSGRTSGRQYENKRDATQEQFKLKDTNKKGKEDDLIIEDNTVYEIDRECYERMNRQKRR